MLKPLALKLIDPRYRRTHIAVITFALVTHLFLHYATYIPALRPVLGDLPYFRLHVLHEAEFLMIVAYAGVVLGLKAGFIAVAITGVTSIPFILTPYIFGRAPEPNEIRDLTIQVGFILVMGTMIILLYDRDQRRRAAEQSTSTLLEVDRVRNNFMSMAAHELRAPMTAVIGFSELAQNPEIPHEQRTQWLDAITREGKRLNGLIEELMSVSRLATGNLKIDLRPLLLPDVVEDAITSAGSSPDHTIVVDVPDSLPVVHADKAKVTQVLVNLINNAIKYSPERGPIWLTAQNTSDDFVRVEVADQGMGIAEEDQSKLFTSFYRVDRPEMDKIAGTGLGLSIVKSLVEMMGGEVGVESTLGQGSTFHFTLPVWHAEKATASQSDTTAAAA